MSFLIPSAYADVAAPATTAAPGGGGFEWIFLIGFVAVCLVAGVPIAFCFGIGAVCYLAFSTHVPLSVVIGRMDEGMSSLVLEHGGHVETIDGPAAEALAQISEVAALLHA